MIDLTQSQSSDESVSLMVDDEYCGDYDDSTHAFDERYARTIVLVHNGNKSPPFPLPLPPPPPPPHNCILLPQFPVKPFKEPHFLKHLLFRGT